MNQSSMPTPPEVPTQKSGRFQLNAEDGKAIIKVLGWSVLSGFCVFLITLIPMVNVPSHYAAAVALMIPAVNTALVALHKWAQDRGSLI